MGIINHNTEQQPQQKTSGSSSTLVKWLVVIAAIIFWVIIFTHDVDEYGGNKLTRWLNGTSQQYEDKKRAERFIEEWIENNPR